MHSDNGTSFVGANRELEELVVEKLDEDKIRVTTADKGVRRHFNPLLPPHFGSAYGSMIKAAKRAIYGFLGNAVVHWCRSPDKLTTFNLSVSES